MGGMLFISCIRFSVQLILSESVFLIGKPRRDHFGIRLCIAFAVYSVSAAGWHFLLSVPRGDIPPLKILYWLGLFMLTMLAMAVCFDMEPLEILFAGIGGYATEHIAFAAAKIMQYATGLYTDQIGVVSEYLLFRLLPYLLAAGIVYGMIIRKNRGKGEIRKHDVRLVWLALLILLAAIGLSVYTDAGIVAQGRSVLRNVICPAYSLLCSILVILIEYDVIRENRLSRENETMEQLLQMSWAQQKGSREAIDIINVKCHDLKHQMKQLMKMDDPAERHSYLEEMRQAVSIYDATYHTGCEALDYVLREKSLLCNEYGISFSCMADGSELLFMRAADIYALMGNALDNAVESVLKEKEVQKRLISLHIVRQGQMVSIHLENTCSGEVTFKDGIPVTDKADRNAHGFGVKSIRYIVRKYQGEVLMRAKNNRFYLDVLLPAQ